jgi:predicted PurR-regulated permease PerM
MDAQATDSRPPLASRITLGRVALVVAAVVLVWALSGVVLLIFFAVLLAVVLRGAADWLAARTGVRVGFMLALVVIAIVALLAGFAFWIGPELVREGNSLAHRLSEQWESLRHGFEGTSIGRAVNQRAPSAAPQGVAERLAAPLEKVVGLSFRTLASFVVLVVTALYFASAPEVYVRGVLHLIPIPYRPRVRQVMGELAHMLRLWLLGQFIDMLAVGVLAAIGLRLVGVPVPYALAVLAGLLTFVPYFGAIVAGIPAVLVALTVSVPTALWALGVFTLCHCVEGYIVGPLVQRRLIELPPALTVLAMTVMATLFGAMGVILGTPLAVVGLISVRMLYVGDVLGDHEAEPARERP